MTRLHAAIISTAEWRHVDVDDVCESVVRLIREDIFRPISTTRDQPIQGLYTQIALQASTQDVKKALAKAREAKQGVVLQNLCNIRH